MFVYVIKLCICYFWLWWHLIICIMIKMIMISRMITMMMTMLSDDYAAHACTWSTRLHRSSQAAAAVLFSAPSQHFPALHNLNFEQLAPETRVLWYVTKSLNSAGYTGYYEVINKQQIALLIPHHPHNKADIVLGSATRGGGWLSPRLICTSSHYRGSPQQLAVNPAGDQETILNQTNKQTKGNTEKHRNPDKSLQPPTILK